MKLNLSASRGALVPGSNSTGIVDIDVRAFKNPAVGKDSPSPRAQIANIVTNAKQPFAAPLMLKFEIENLSAEDLKKVGRDSGHISKLIRKTDLSLLFLCIIVSPRIVFF